MNAFLSCPLASDLRYNEAELRAIRTNSLLAYRPWAGVYLFFPTCCADLWKFVDIGYTLVGPIRITGDNTPIWINPKSKTIYMTNERDQLAATRSYWSVLRNHITPNKETTELNQKRPGTDDNKLLYFKHAKAYAKAYGLLIRSEEFVAGLYLYYVSSLDDIKALEDNGYIVTGSSLYNDLQVLTDKPQELYPLNGEPRTFIPVLIKDKEVWRYRPSVKTPLNTNSKIWDTAMLTINQTPRNIHATST